MKKIFTLCIIHKDSHVLLGLKKRGFGAGRWNGFGGHVEAGESIEEAARREVFEEAGIAVKSLEKVGVLEFAFDKKPESFEVHLFRANDFEGEPVEGEEMKPRWFHINKLPFDKMWPDDRYWYPLFLQNKKFNGKFLFKDLDNLIEYKLTPIES